MIDDLRQSPATLSLATLWVLVFAMMQVRQGASVSEMNPFSMGMVHVSTTHQFGDATTAELVAGQLWRAATATFVHYSLLHLLLNLIGLVQLGVLVEEWYGSPQFLAIYMITGGLGNLLAGLARPFFGIPPNVHSGGGSTVVFGLIALCAVVGFRSRDREDRRLGWVMVVILLVNVALAVVFWALNRWLRLGLPNFDNLAHTGGALMGALLGLAHKTLCRLADRPLGRGLGLLGASLLIASMAAQTRASRAEFERADQQAMALGSYRDALADLQRARSVRDELVRLEILYRMAFYRGQHPETISDPTDITVLQFRPDRLIVIPQQAVLMRELRSSAERLKAHEAEFARGAAERPFRRLLALAGQAVAKPPTRLRLQEFAAHLAAVHRHTLEDERLAVSRLNDLSRGRLPAQTPGRSG